MLEDRCLGTGHAACHLKARTREQWGNQRAEELDLFDRQRLAECLDVSLSRVMATLKAAETTLQARRKALVPVTDSVDETLGIVAKSTAMQHVVELARRVAAVDAGFRTVGAPVERVVSETLRFEASPLGVLARGAALRPDPLERAEAVDSVDLRGDEALARWLLCAADLPEVNPRLKPVPPAGVEANFSDLGVATRARTPCPSGVSGR